MHPEELWAVLKRRPFVPFRLHVSDGAIYDISHPDALLLTRRAAHIGVASEGQIPERAVIVSLIHVSRVEELPSPAAGSSNGQ